MKSNPILPLIFCLAVGGAAAFGQSVEELGIGKPSSFQYIEGDRDPFWPIGWSKKALVVNNTAGGPVLVEAVPRADSFYVTSISLDRIPLAVINGKAYGIGDRFLWNAPAGKGDNEKTAPKTFRLQVVAIRDGVVVLRYGSVDLTCPLRVIGTPGTPTQSPSPASK